MLLLGFSAFLAVGVVLVLVGANQAALAQALDMDLAGSGLLSAALALGAGVGVTGAGPIVDRHPRRPLFVASLLLAALALLTIHPGVSYARAFAHLAVLGVGIGFFDTLLNAVVIQHSGARTARTLALLHAGATAGAVGGPFLIAALSRAGDWTWSFHATGWALVGLAAWAACVPLPLPERHSSIPRAGEGATQARGPANAPPARLLSLALLALAGVGFAYVGVETALTVFAVPWATELLALPPSHGQTAISALWLGLLAGRLGMLVVRRELGVPFLLASGVTGACILSLAALIQTPRIEIASFATGLSLGAVFPVMIALAGRRFPQASGTAAGLVAGAGACGGFMVPWLAGVVGDRSGMGAALLTVALFTGMISLSALLLWRRPAASPRAQP